MSHDDNWTIPTDAETYFRQEQKRTAWLERRPSVRKAADIMGPALGPTAIYVENLNGEIALFNGMYLVPPGAVGSPDASKWWAGTTVADTTTGGTQFLSTFRPADAPHVQQRRGFAYSPDGSGQQFGPWEDATIPPPEPSSPWMTSGLAISAESGWSVSEYRLRRHRDRLQGYVAASRSTTIAFDTAANTPDIHAFTLPSIFHPSIGHHQPVLVERYGVTQFYGRLLDVDASGTSGGVLLTHGSLASYTLAASTTLRFWFDHPMV